MCRIFGFRSVLDSHVHRSLLDADNALAVQSERHPDGWGVAYYVAGSPHLVRAAATAMSDQLFRRVSGVVTSQTVLAHIRKATQGDLHALNCHPFQYGRWVMAHNGDVPGFSQIRDDLLAHVGTRYRPFLLGETDSEVIFLVFMTHLAKVVDPTRRGTPVDAVVDAMRSTIATVRSVADGRTDFKPASLSLVVTDGELMVAHQGGRSLHWTSHKNACSEREACTFFSPECEAPTRTGYVNHLIVSSEPLQGENVWIELQVGEIVAVDSFMRLHHFPSEDQAGSAAEPCAASAC